MADSWIKTLVDQFSERHVLVIGDYFLDFYLDLDRGLSEMSLETGLEAYQVVQVRARPGAAGTVTANLRSLGLEVTALGVIGRDGMGYELMRSLDQLQVHTDPMIQLDDRFTPTYTKPMMHENDGTVHELNRLDIKNRTSLSPHIQDLVIDRLHHLLPQVDGVIVADQVQERNCGVITDSVRSELAALAQKEPDKPIAADSRVRIGEFGHVLIKPNAREATLAVHPLYDPEAIDRAIATASAAELYQRNGRPVFLTVGADGILVYDQDGMTHVRGIQVEGPIDIVGAGDSTMAGIVSALCCGASNAQAALVGNLVASITIQQLGTTGTATPTQVVERHGQVFGNG